VSIVKVAQLAGVSKSTVSLVINNSPTIPPQTALKVRQAMSALSYVPCPREQRKGPKPGGAGAKWTQNIALCAIGFPAAVLRAPLYSDVLHGIEGGVRERNYRLTLSHLPNPKDWGVDEIMRSGAEGFLLFGGGESDAAARALREFPCVTLMGAQDVRPWCDWVSFDEVAVGQLAAAHLAQKGHRTCAFVGMLAGARGNAFRKAFHAAGGRATLHDTAGLIRAHDDLHEVDSVGLRKVVEHILALSPRPTGIFSWSDILTAALYPVLHSCGVKPGRDVDVVSCNNEWPLLMGLSPRPAVVDIQGSKVGRRAVEQLFWRIAHRKESRVVIRLAPLLLNATEPAAQNSL
jgi:LacI family transcriptional regulator